MGDDPGWSCLLKHDMDAQYAKAREGEMVSDNVK